MSNLRELLTLAANDAATEHEVRSAAAKALEVLSKSKLPALTITIGDQEFDVFVSPQGRFQATYEGRNYYGETLEALRKGLTTATRRKKIEVAVPYSRLLDTNVIHGIGRSLDSRSYNTVLVTERYKKGKLEGRDNWVMQRLTADEAAELEQLAIALKDAEQQFKAFTEPRKLNLAVAVRSAVEEAELAVPALEEKNDAR